MEEADKIKQANEINRLTKLKEHQELAARLRHEAMLLDQEIIQMEDVSQSSIPSEKLPDEFHIDYHQRGPDQISKNRSADHIEKNIYVSSQDKAVILKDKIDSELASKFLTYYERPEIIKQNHDYRTILHGDALTRIRLRLRSGTVKNLVKQEDIETFPVIADGSILTILEIAKII